MEASGDSAEVVFEKWFREQPFADAFTGESKTMMMNTFVAGWQAHDMFDSARLVDPEKVERLRGLLRLKMAQSPLWQPLVEGIQFGNMALAGPVRVDEWTLDECRDVWEWLRGNASTPSCLTDEIDRIRAWRAPTLPTCPRVAGDRGGRENRPCGLGLTHAGDCADRRQLSDAVAACTFCDSTRCGGECEDDD